VRCVVKGCENNLLNSEFKSSYSYDLSKSVFMQKLYTFYGDLTLENLCVDLSNKVMYPTLFNQIFFYPRKIFFEFQTE
jgi:hypothetical protein